ncbi:hypothetical protein ACBY01_08520 [Sphingomonas sp. ac-8]|uniref:hypothetical protein n=1 Tax=Sphingomonas sp. ac-8 TaxID=3242977 RepID=UPI003A801E71
MTHGRTRHPLALSALAAALALAACSPAPTTESQAVENGEAPAVTGGDAAPAAAPTPLPSSPSATAADAGATTGGDGSDIRLSALSTSDISGAKLDGELACSFAGRDGAALLHAAGNVGSSERAFGVVKLGDTVESVSAPGGYDGMLRGTTFSGRGKTLRIGLGSEESKQGGESPPRAATLTFQRMDRASRSYPGTWTCGP